MNGILEFIKEVCEDLCISIPDSIVTDDKKFNQGTQLATLAYENEKSILYLRTKYEYGDVDMAFAIAHELRHKYQIDTHVFDFDNYKKSTLSRNKLIELNKEELCRCFKGAYRNALYNILITKYIPNSIGKMMDLFNPDVDNLPSHVTKKLVKHPNLLHFFEDRNV